MDRTLLLDMKEITNANVHQLLSQAESFKLRMPEILDGWYVAGLCYCRLGDRGEALFNLCTAQQIAPDEKIKSLIERLGGDMEKMKRYRLLHNLKANTAIILNILVLALTIIFIYLMVTTK